MKAKMYSAVKNSELHDHIIDGFEVTHRGLKQLKDLGHVTEEEYTLLLEKNIYRLVTRIREFRTTEKLLSVFFAFLFLLMQVTGDDLEARRPSRSRTRTSSSRSARGRTSKGGRSGRRNDCDTGIDLEAVA